MMGPMMMWIGIAKTVIYHVTLVIQSNLIVPLVRVIHYLDNSLLVHMSNMYQIFIVSYMWINSLADQQYMRLF